MVQSNQFQDPKIVPKERHTIQAKTYCKESNYNKSKDEIIQTTITPLDEEMIMQIKYPALSKNLMVFYDLRYLGIQKDYRSNQWFAVQKKRVDHISERVE